jgi:hypothetical protein
LVWELIVTHVVLFILLAYFHVSADQPGVVFQSETQLVSVTPNNTQEGSLVTPSEAPWSNSAGTKWMVPSVWWSVSMMAFIVLVLEV